MRDLILPGLGKFSVLCWCCFFKMESVLRGFIVSVQGRRSLARRPAAPRSWTTETRKEERREKAAGEEEVGRSPLNRSQAPPTRAALALNWKAQGSCTNRNCWNCRNGNPFQQFPCRICNITGNLWHSVVKMFWWRVCCGPCLDLWHEPLVKITHCRSIWRYIL